MNPEEAFASLHQAACDELRAVQAQGVEWFNQSEFTRAKEAAEQAEKINGLITSLQELHARWKGVLPPKVSPLSLVIEEETPRVILVHKQTRVSSPNRTPPGIRTHQNCFKLPILQVLVEMGGHGLTNQILDHVEQIMDDILNETDRELLPKEGAIRWRNAAQWARLEMVRDGYLSSNSPHGVWEITDVGRRFLKNHS